MLTIRPRTRCCGRVLIPSSSGCGAHIGALASPPRPSGLNPFFFRVRCSPIRAERLAARAAVLIPSSSGCGAHTGPSGVGARPPGLNPFFFRVRCSLGEHLVRRLARGLNPFFFRVRCSLIGWRWWRVDRVLIPSSSGCGAHRGQRRAASGVHVLIPSSSGCGAHAAGHRGPANRARLNPFFFRVRCSRGLAQPLRRRGLVLIPSSSGCGAHFASWRCTSS